MRGAAVLVAAVLAVGSTSAAAPPGAMDPRLRVVRYEPGQVYEVSALPGYMLTIEFSEGERIENVGVGDALSWQITPNRRANLLFVKPVAARARTNMTVITSLRRYAFVLATQKPGRRDAPYALRFTYDEPGEAVPDVQPRPAPIDLNHAYVISGATTGRPERIFDDGRATYFAFPADADLPAIYALDRAGREALTNGGVRDGLLVVEQVAPGFVLRSADRVITVHNSAYPQPAEAESRRRRP